MMEAVRKGSLQPRVVAPSAVLDQSADTKPEAEPSVILGGEAEAEKHFLLQALRDHRSKAVGSHIP